MLARLKNFIFGDEETNGLSNLPRATLNDTNLRKLSRSEGKLIMRATLPEWASSSAELARIHPIEDTKTGGVNPGDRHAVYRLMRSLRPANVLEIGTHVGASTLDIAAGLKQNGAGDLTTVDVKDVNAPDGYWKHFRLVGSPANAIFRNRDDIQGQIQDHVVGYRADRTEQLRFYISRWRPRRCDVLRRATACAP
jgi:hypothetical protein